MPAKSRIWHRQILTSFDPIEPSYNVWLCAKKMSMIAFLIKRFCGETSRDPRARIGCSHITDHGQNEASTCQHRSRSEYTQDCNHIKLESQRPSSFPSSSAANLLSVYPRRKFWSLATTCVHSCPWVMQTPYQESAELMYTCICRLSIVKRCSEIDATNAVIMLFLCSDATEYCNCLLLCFYGFTGSILAVPVPYPLCPVVTLLSSVALA